MPFISSNGSVQDDRTPLTVDWFRNLISGFFAFVYLFFATLFGFQSSSKDTNRYQADYRDQFRTGPGGGAGGNYGAPRNRNVGRLGGGGGGPSCPPMAGGG